MCQGCDDHEGQTEAALSEGPSQRPATSSCALQRAARRAGSGRRGPRLLSRAAISSPRRDLPREPQPGSPESASSPPPGAPQPTHLLPPVPYTQLRAAKNFHPPPPSLANFLPAFPELDDPRICKTGKKGRREGGRERRDACFSLHRSRLKARPLARAADPQQPPGCLLAPRRSAVRAPEEGGLESSPSPAAAEEERPKTPQPEKVPGTPSEEVTLPSRPPAAASPARPPARRPWRRAAWISGSAGPARPPPRGVHAQRPRPGSRLGPGGTPEPRCGR